MIYSMRQSLAEPKPLWEVSRLIYAPWILDNVWNVVDSVNYHLYQPISHLIFHKIQTAFDNLKHIPLNFDGAWLPGIRIGKD